MLQRIISVLVLLLLTSVVLGHEFWLEPINFEVGVNEEIRAHEKVGQDFKGNKYAYLSSSYESLNLTLGEFTRPVKSRLGDLPAVSELVKKEGLAILSAVTTSSDVKYETWEKFSNFIKSKGLGWVLDEHKKRKLPEKNFVELYRRYAKSLLKIGHGKGNDRALGLEFEWIVETNPYTTKEKAIKAQLLWKGSPHVSAHVSVFNRIENDLIKSELMTDNEGKVEIPRAKGGVFLLNAVQMIEAQKDIQNGKNAVWESLWASMTYELN